MYYTAKDFLIDLDTQKSASRHGSTPLSTNNDQGIAQGEWTMPKAAPTTPLNRGTQMEVTWREQTHVSPTDPKVWGPAMWLVLHTGSAHYPKKASPVYADKMKGFIRGLPYIIPCEICANHARTFIAQNWSRIDQIVSGQDELFRFFCEFHNKVNARYQKPIVDCEEIKNMYTHPVTVKKMSYTNP